MSTSIVEHIVVEGESSQNPLTIYLNSDGNIFMHENNGEEICDFWTCISYEDWLEVVKFIDQQKRESNV